jgi:GNAT superfamily N-acetyltransferase
VKSVGKKAAKYVAPLAVGLAGAAAAHYLTKGKKSTAVDDGRYTDATLPFADSNESSFRERAPREVAPRLSPEAIKTLYAMQALSSAFNPSTNHPWTHSGSGVNWIPGKRQWDWLTGGSLVGPTTLAALAANRGAVDPEYKLRHLADCKHCQGKGIGKKLWNGIKSAGKTVYDTAKPYALPVGAALATGALGYYALKNGGAEQIQKIAQNAAESAQNAGKYVTELPGRFVHNTGNTIQYYNTPEYRPLQFDYDKKVKNQPVGWFGLGSLG